MTTVLVTGPEASGNRMLCRMLTEGGATVLHKPMPISTHWRPGMPGDPAAWEGVWTDFSTLEWDQAVVIVRHPVPTVAAQTDAGHTRDADHATARTRAALVAIFTQLGETDRPWWCVPYESLADPRADAALCGLLGLDATGVVTRWQDANAKWWGGEPWSDRTPLWKRPIHASLVTARDT